MKLGAGVTVCLDLNYIRPEIELKRHAIPLTGAI